MSGKTFVNICGNRIKVSNIKHFGISSNIKYYAKVYEASIDFKGSFAGGLARILTGIGTLYEINRNCEDYNRWEISEGEYLDIKNGLKRPIYLLIDKDDIDKIKLKRVCSLDDGESYLVKSQEVSTYELGVEQKGSILITSTPDDVFEEKTRYLYITTYQNDNFTFYEDECDIDEKLAELDSL